MAATRQPGAVLLRFIGTGLGTRCGGLGRGLPALDGRRLGLGKTANLLGFDLDGRTGHPRLPVLSLGLVRLHVVDVIEAWIERTSGVIGIAEWIEPHRHRLNHLGLLLGWRLDIGFSAGELGQHLGASVFSLTLLTTRSESHTAVHRTLYHCGGTEEQGPRGIHTTNCHSEDNNF